MELTRDQQRAIEGPRANLQLIACAGSGKTEVVARRVANLLDSRTSPKLAPAEIVAFTFTNKAAAELKHRIQQRVSELPDPPLAMADLYVGTIHGYCAKLLQDHATEYLKFETLNEMQQQLFLQRHSRASGLTETTTLQNRTLRRYGRDTKMYLSALNVLREDVVDFDALEECTVADGLYKYEALLRERGYFDYSAILKIAVEQIEAGGPLAEQIKRQIKYVIVDEYQDVNPIQERLVAALHNLGARICIVGDDDQTIYQWRGSDVENIIKFEDRYPRVKSVRLQENFRSSQGVVATAGDFIAQVEDRLPKQMQPASEQQYEAGDITALEFDSPGEEADWIAEQCRGMRGLAFNEGGASRGLSWSDMAVLVRVRASMGPIVDAFRAADIPYVVSGNAGLFDTLEAQAARALFHFIANIRVTSQNLDEQPPEPKELRNQWKAAVRAGNSRVLSRGLRYAEQVRDRLQEERTQGITLQGVFLDFLERAGIREDGMGDGGDVVMFNLGKFSQLISDYESINHRSSRTELFEGFVKFLYFHADGAYAEGMDDSPFAPPDAVQISTVHQAKGREWAAVFIPALQRNRFPGAARPSSIWQLIPEEAVAGGERYDGSNEDERRLFYVAMTRSKKFLHFTWAPQAAKGRYSRPSDFWDEIRGSRYVSRSLPDYSARPRLKPQPKLGIENVELSFSELKYFFQCPYEFKIRVLYGFNGPIAEPLGYGKGLHDALAEMHRRAMNGDFASADEAASLVDTHLRLPYAGDELDQRLRQAAERTIAKYIRDNADELSNIVFTEKDVEIALEEGVTVSGRIDLVRRLDTDEVSIVDLKSTSRAQAEEVTEKQLNTYVLGYEQLTGERADWVEIHDLDKGKRRPRPVEDSLVEEVRRDAQRAADALRKQRFPAKPSARKCVNCDFQMICSSGEKALAAARSRG